MLQKDRTKAPAICLGLAVGAVLAGAAFAGLLDDREATMRQMARALHSLQEMSKQHAFEAAETARRGREIAALLLRVKDLFPAGSEHADQTAGPAIWTDRAGFEQARANAYDAALALAQVTGASGLPGAIQHLAQACAACHDKFKIRH